MRELPNEAAMKKPEVRERVMISLLERGVVAMEGMMDHFRFLVSCSPRLSFRSANPGSQNHLPAPTEETSAAEDLLAAIGEHLEGEHGVFPPRRGDVVTNAALLEGGALSDDVGDEMFVA